MFNFKKLAACLASVICLLETSIMSVSAADAVITDRYTYMVTVSTGSDLVFDASDADFSIRVKACKDTKYVEITEAADSKAVDKEENSVYYVLKDGGRRIEISGLSYGDYVDISKAIDTIDFSATKYRQKGIRVSGSNDIISLNIKSEKDSEVNLETDCEIGLQVKGDSDYVVAYGLLSDPVEYTVQYVDQDGNKLVDDAGPFIGNAGDKFIVASRQIDGYVPDANNKAMTLSKEKENVFTFVYHSLEGVVNVIYNSVTGTTTYIFEDGATSTVTVPNPANGQAGAVVTPPAANAGAGNANAGNAGAGNADAGNADAGNADAGNTDENTVIADEDTPLTTQDIVDLDADEEVPLAAQVQETVTNLAPIIAGIFVAVAAAGMITLLVISRRRKAVNVKSEDSDK